MSPSSVPDVSVIVPFKNAEPYVGELLLALSQQQNAPSFEVIAVDNGSSDGSSHVVEDFGTRLSLRLIRATERFSCAYARNVGVRQARAGKFLFIDADDVVDLTYVGVMARALDHFPFVTSRVDSEALNASSVVEAHGGFWQAEAIGVFFDFLPAAGSNVGVDSALFRKLGGFCEALTATEDIAFSWEAQLTAGIQIHLVPDAVYLYRYRENTRRLFQQTRHWGSNQVKLYSLFRSRGMPPRSWATAAKDWRAALRAACRPGSRASRAKAAVLLGYCVGRLYGSVQCGVRYL